MNTVLVGATPELLLDEELLVNVVELLLDELVNVVELELDELVKPCELAELSELELLLVNVVELLLVILVELLLDELVNVVELEELLLELELLSTTVVLLITNIFLEGVIKS